MRLSSEEYTLLDKKRMQNANNTVFMETIFSLASKYNIFTEEDIAILTSEKSHELFGASTKPILLEITDLDEETISKRIHDEYESGRSITRYYRNPEYKFLNRVFLASNDMYGKYKDGEKRVSDNRTPLYEWFMEKIGLNNDGPIKIGIFDSWEIYSETVAIKTCDISFFNHHGSGIPIAIRWFWESEYLESGSRRNFQISYNGNNYSAYVEKRSSQNGRTRLFWSTDLAKELQEFENKLECKAVFTKKSSDVYLLKMKWKEEEGENQLSAKETLASIKNYIAAKGFTFDEGLVENYYLSLKSKPFVILAGTSGTGKTRLVRLFAEAIGATSQNGRYKLVSVRPDWSDSSDLFGHVNLNDKFIPGAIIDFVKQAELDSRNPYFLCLDEMNLARVEYYLSDILSIIETREYVDGKVTTDPIITENYYGADATARGKYGIVRIPENLYIIGTVNMDETTFPFSRKVLDRANTIEFSTVELLANFDFTGGEAKAILADNTFMKAEYVFFNQCATDKDFVEEICIELQNINKILEKANAHVGYRVRDEIVFYMLNNKNADNLLTRDEAFDHEIMQKILPRIQGSSASVKIMLCELFKYCAGDYESYQTESDDVSAKMMAAANKETCKYKESAKKIAFMVRRFEEDGFTAYWL